MLPPSLKRLLFATALTLTTPMLAAAQNLNIVVPFAGGDDGLLEFLTDMIIEDLGHNTDLNVSLIVDPGKNRGPYDVYADVSTGVYEDPTVVVMMNDLWLAAPFVAPETAANPFTPLGSVFTFPLILVAPKTAPYLNFETLADVHYDETVKMGYLLKEAGSTKQMLAMARYFEFEFDLPASRKSPNCEQILSGEVTVMITMPELLVGCEDDVRTILSLTTKPNPTAPDAEILPDVVGPLAMSFRAGYYVPESFPQELRTVISDSIQKTLSSARAQELAKATITPFEWQSAEDERKSLASDVEAMGKIQSYLN